MLALAKEALRTVTPEMSSLDICSVLKDLLNKNGIGASINSGWTVFDRRDNLGNWCVPYNYISVHYGRCRTYLDITTALHNQWFILDTVPNVVFKHGRPSWYRESKPSLDWTKKRALSRGHLMQ